MTPKGLMKSREHYGALQLVDAPAIGVSLMRVRRYEFTGGPFDFILGMNVLARWDFRFDRLSRTLIVDAGS
jgi:hypothetical protein